MRKYYSLLLASILVCNATAREYHVAVQGDDNAEGTRAAPFRTIAAASRLAQPGDVITVHEGTYRERVTPVRGGTSDDLRIVYRAAPGETVMIKGSEVINSWESVEGSVWKVVLPNDFFGDYNPYADEIRGDWFADLGRKHHTGEVYLNGRSLYEVDALEKVLHPKTLAGAVRPEESLYTWYTEVDEDTTTIWANFHGYDPNSELVEINMRPACFYPDRPGVNYITVRGFHMRHAATQWAPPTAEQIGLIGTFWSKGWVIEDNVISDSKCAGITLGKDRASGHNAWQQERSDAAREGRPARGGAVIYNVVIQNALANGWSRENVGSHVVRNNTIYNCEQAGICGSLGAVFSTISGNHIYDIWVKRQYDGAEVSAIKLHAPIDVLIEDNHIHHAKFGIWLDWMTQGARVTRNLLHDNLRKDICLEVNHGPFVVDNNLLLSDAVSLWIWSEGGAFVQNLIAGQLSIIPSGTRATAIHEPHSTRIRAFKGIQCGDDRFYNNIFLGGSPVRKSAKLRDDQLHGYGTAIYADAGCQLTAVDGNIYLKGARHYPGEQHYLELPAFDPELTLTNDESGWYLTMTYGSDWLETLKTQPVTGKRLGETLSSRQTFKNPDGSSLAFDTGFLGKKRRMSDPMPGPFAGMLEGRQRFKVSNDRPAYITTFAAPGEASSRTKNRPARAEITLAPKAAQISPVGGARYVKDHDVVGFWRSTDSVITWDVDVTEPGEYEVIASLGCPEQFAGSRVALRVGDRESRFTAVSTGGFFKYADFNLGTFSLSRGKTQVALQAVEIPSHFVANIKTVRLEKK